MLLFEQLEWSLTKVVTLILKSNPHLWVLNRTDIEVARLVSLIGDLAVSVQTVNCLLVPLLAPKYVVNPHV